MTSTQLEDHGAAKSGDGTASGMIAWLDWLISHNEMPAPTASSWRTACQKVLDVESDLDQVDMRTADLDAIINRFRNKYRGSSMKEKTIDTYEQRFRQTADMYRKWLADDDDWRPARRRRSSGTSTKKTDAKQSSAPSKTPSVTPPAPTVEDVGSTLIKYPFPIRPGLQGSISLPEDLTTREAERIAKFVASLAFEDEPVRRAPLAITARSDSTA